jgi:hypothetical protein
MATYKLQTKTDIKFICILDREVRLKHSFKAFLNIEHTYNVF